MVAGPWLCLNGIQPGQMGSFSAAGAGLAAGSPRRSFLLRTATMSRLLSVALSVVILSLAPWVPAAAQTGVEYGHMVSQPKGGSPVSSRAFEVKTRSSPKKPKAKRLQRRQKKPRAGSSRPNHHRKS